MRDIVLRRLAVSLCIGLSFAGCGESTTQAGVKEPFNAQKLHRAVSVQKDWTWSVSAEVNYATNEISVIGWSGIPQNVKHLQLFIDSDNNKETGFSGKDGWEIEGADFLIEDGIIFTYAPHLDKDFAWTLHSSFDKAYFFSKELGESREYHLSDYHFGLSDLFKNTSKMNIMIEAYDANWDGGFNTVTDIDADITKGDEPVANDKEVKLSATKHVKIHDKVKGDEEFDGSFTYEYNEQGQDGPLLSKKIITEKGEVASTTEYSYDETDTLIQEVVTKAGGLPHTYTYTYTYNNAGDILSKTTFVDGKEYSTTDYTYNEAGQLTKESSGGTPTLYHYNDKGQRIQKSRQDADGRRSMTLDYIYDAKGHVIEDVYRLFVRGNSVETTVHYTWGTL